jgi:hypothetical protein
VLQAVSFVCVVGVGVAALFVCVDLRQNTVQRVPLRASVIFSLADLIQYGRVAQVVERSLSMGEVVSSNLISSNFF